MNAIRNNSLARGLERFFTDPYYIAAFFVAFVLVFIKKWEVGGHIDAIWYSAMAKNIHQSGDYFKFGINPYFYSDYYDHFPLTYWAIAKTFDLFGVSDFTACLYPMLCSFFGYLAMFKVGERIRDRHFGLICVLTWALCFAASKYAGSVRMDTPLTAFYILAFYFFLRGLEKPASFYWVSLFVALGVFTKGPIIGGFGLGLFLWTLATRSTTHLRQKHFWGAIVLLAALLAIPFIPALYFQGQNYYWFYYLQKKSYLQPDQQRDYFFYFLNVPKQNPLTALTFLLSLPLLFRRNRYFSGESRTKLQAAFWIGFGIIAPLSIFNVKFAYYMLPFYPFFALVAAMWPDAYTRGLTTFPIWIKRIAIAACLFFVCFPVKTSGKRAKTQINMANQLKLDPDIDKKPVYFLGGYEDDMQIFQTFKFYGNISLRPIKPADLTGIDLKKSYLIVGLVQLPLNVGGVSVGKSDCVFTTEAYCILTGRENLTYKLPDLYLPHEIY